MNERDCRTSEARRPNAAPARWALAALAALALPASAQTAPSAVDARLRNTVTVSADASRDTSRPAGGNSGTATGLLFDLEYARSVWGSFELTAAAGARGMRLKDGTGASAAYTFRHVAVGGRAYFWEPRREAWTPYVDAAVGEGTLERSGNGGDTTQRMLGYSAGLGLAAHLSPRADLRVAARYERYKDTDEGAAGRDTAARLGLRLGVAFRF